MYSIFRSSAAIVWLGVLFEVHISWFLANPNLPIYSQIERRAEEAEEFICFWRKCDAEESSQANSVNVESIHNDGIVFDDAGKENFIYI